MSEPISERRANRIATFLMANGLSSRVVRTFDQDQWRMAANAARYEDCSFETQAAVIAEMEYREGVIREVKLAADYLAEMDCAHV